MTAITESKNKSIYKNTSVFDLNLLTNPLFVCNIKEEVKTIEYLENNCSLTDDVKNVLNVLAQGQQKESLRVVYRKWFDGNGIKKELLIANSFPTLQTADVWDGLIGLYLSKITPITFDSNNNCFSINEESFEFTLYELAKFMHKAQVAHLWLNWMKR